MRMNEISIFVDESGDPGETSRYYLIALVFHEQHASIDRIVQPYLQSLIDKGLADIPAHIGPLVNGHDDYENLTMETRKIYLSSFRILAEHLPFRYATLAYEKAWFDDDPVKLLTRMKRDLTSFLFDRIEYLQRFDAVKIYYDNGQAIVTEALHDAVEYVLGKNAIVYKDASPRKYRLSQVADYICSLELTALKFASNDARPTDTKFFGQWGSFKKNYLRKLRKKRLN